MSDVVIVAVVAGLSPCLLFFFTSRGRRKDQQTEWARQDAVAARVAEVARVVSATSSETNTKLDVIHTLVNSQLSDAIRNELAAFVELADFKKSMGYEPTAEALERIAELRVKIADREAQQDIAERQ